MLSPFIIVRNTQSSIKKLELCVQLKIRSRSKTTQVCLKKLPGDEGICLILKIMKKDNKHLLLVIA